MSQKMSFNATWAMAVGGMVGGGIFSVLGVVIATAGKWAWLSFLLAGIIAFISAYSYSRLSLKFQEGGGAFTFLRKVNREGFAGALSWILIMGYILTISVYAFTFGQYVSHVLGSGAWLPRLLSLLAIGSLTWLNLRGAGEAARLEIVTVYGKLFVLLGLALIGLWSWAPEQLDYGSEEMSWTSAILGAAGIFMGYEGFQLLSYDYDELQNPTKNLPRATMIAVISVIITYVLVTLGATMLVGASALVEQKEVALAVAGQQALGTTGLVLVTIAAAFSTGSAINATLFSTARLMESVAEKRDLPQLLARENNEKVPVYAVISIAFFSAALAAFGDLGTIVEAASLVFLFTFGVVNLIAFQQNVPWKWFCLVGALACAASMIFALYEQAQKAPMVLAVILSISILIFVGRPYFLRKKD